MWQGNNIRHMAVKTEAVAFTNNRIEFFDGHDLGDRQFANGQNELRFEELQFCNKPFGAIVDFILIWHPIPTAGVFPGKTTTHRGHIDFLPERLFLQANAVKPAEQSLACRPGKRAVELDLPVARRLANQ